MFEIDVKDKVYCIDLENAIVLINLLLEENIISEEAFNESQIKRNKLIEYKHDDINEKAGEDNKEKEEKKLKWWQNIFEIIYDTHKLFILSVFLISFIFFFKELSEEI